MKPKTKGTLLITLAVFNVIVGFLIFLPRTHARQDKSPAVNQGWKVVVDVAPKNLQEELEKLNKEGYSIPTNAIMVVDGNFTIIVNDDSKGEDEEEEGHSDK